MLAVTTPILWYTTRATGAVTLILFSAAVVLGILTSTRAASTRWPRFAVSDLHRRLSLLAVAFLAVHILTSVADSFVPIGWPSVVVPFTSAYRPLWVGLGTVAFDLMLAVLVSSLLRSRLDARLWRGVHWLAYLSWPVAVAHGIGIGTDLRFGWMDVIAGLCVGSVVAACAWRVWAHPRVPGLRTAAPKEPPASLTRPGGTPAPGTTGAAAPAAGDRRLVARSTGRVPGPDRAPGPGRGEGRERGPVTPGTWRRP